MPHRFEPRDDFVERLEGPDRAAALPLDRIIPSMSLSGSDTVIDVGSGTGYFSLPMSRFVKRVVALDLEPKMVQHLSGRVRNEGAENAEPVQADAVALPIASAAADHVLAAFIYHEVQDPALLLKECARVLVPSGRLTVIDFQKKETAFGPPLRDRITPEEVVEAARGLFAVVSRVDGEVYYQIELAKA